MFKKNKIDRNFLDSLYRQYSPKQSKSDLELAMKNFEKKEKYEKKMILAKLKYLHKANEIDNSTVSYMSLFGIFLSTIILYFKDIINNPYISYFLITVLFIYVLYSFSKVFLVNRVIRAEIEYLVSLLDNL